MFSLERKTVLVTGASSGIGRAISQSLSGQGASVVVTGRDRERLGETFRTLSGAGGVHRQLIADLTSRDDVAVMVDGLPELSGVVFCAGVIDYLPARLVDEASVRKVFDINFESQLLLYKELHSKKKLAKGSSLVFISSVSALSGVPGTVLYAASKAAVSSSARVLASELAKYRIRVNSVSPGLIRTPLLNNEALDSETIQANENKYPLGTGTPVDVANAVVFLLSDEARWITGIDLIVDGGYMLRR